MVRGGHGRSGVVGNHAQDYRLRPGRTDQSKGAHVDLARVRVRGRPGFGGRSGGGSAFRMTRAGATIGVVILHSVVKMRSTLTARLPGGKSGLRPLPRRQDRRWPRRSGQNVGRGRRLP